MTKQQLNFQDTFLNQVRKESQEIKVVMMNGASIIGVVKGFDNFTVMLQSRGAQHLLYKHAIAQLISRRHEIRKPGEAPSESERPETAGDPTQPAPRRDDSKPRDTRERKEHFNKIDVSNIAATADNTPHS